MPIVSPLPSVTFFSPPSLSSSANVANKGKETSVVFKGDGFLTYQIRFIVGAAFKVAYGELPLEEVKKRIDAEERSILSYKAPAEGLTLVYVGYE